MARAILAFFGGFSILLGIVIILVGVRTENGTALTISLGAGSAFLIAGAPLLGFARVIKLLEQIETNTRSASSPRVAPPAQAGSLAPTQSREPIAGIVTPDLSRDRF